MDPERRNRVAALLATTDQIPAALGRELLAAHDAAVTQAKQATSVLRTCQQQLGRYLGLVEKHKLNADRLAAWIIHHPVPGPEMKEVLDLHDRT